MASSLSRMTAACILTTTVAVACNADRAKTKPADALIGSADASASDTDRAKAAAAAKADSGVVDPEGLLLLLAKTHAAYDAELPPIQAAWESRRDGLTRISQSQVAAGVCSEEPCTSQLPEHQQEQSEALAAREALRALRHRIAWVDGLSAAIPANGGGISSVINTAEALISTKQLAADTAEHAGQPVAGTALESTLANHRRVLALLGELRAAGGTPSDFETKLTGVDKAIRAAADLPLAVIGEYRIATPKYRDDDLKY